LRPSKVAFVVGEEVRPVFYFSAAGIVSCLLLGGGTRNGFLPDTILQFLTLPVLIAGLWRAVCYPLSREMRRALAFCGLVLAVPALQLIPLPSSLWNKLPGRETIASAYDLIGRDLPWAPVSMSPAATWLSAIGFLPALAVFICVLFLNRRERRLLSLVVLGVGLASAFLGLIQVAQGPSSPLRFFEYTNPSETVGFFANRNHFAALIYCLIPLTAVWTGGNALAILREYRPRRFDAAAIAPLVVSFAILVVLLAAEAMARSRAGLALTVLALSGAFAVVWWSTPALGHVTPARLTLGAAALVLVFDVQFASYRILERFDTGLLADARPAIARTTIEAAKAVMPFGAGVGTFVPVYAMFEKPPDLMMGTYVNHAHNDVLELWLETGVMGFILAGAFATWAVPRALAVWQSSCRDGTEIDRSLARAATVIILLAAIHSLVDYPLRTAAMMAVVAFACALLIPPVSSPPLPEKSSQFSLCRRESKSPPQLPLSRRKSESV
jgi:O-antigen ligase